VIEPTKTRKDDLRRLVLYTFKGFTRIAKTAPNYIVNRLCSNDVDQRGERVAETQKLLWEMRSRAWDTCDISKSFIIDVGEKESLLQSEEEDLVNLCKEIPYNGVEFVNLFTKLCPKCPGKAIMSRKHLLSVHNLNFLDPIELFEEIHQKQEEIGGTRTARVFFAFQRIKQEIDRVNEFIFN